MLNNALVSWVVFILCCSNESKTLKNKSSFSFYFLNIKHRCKQQFARQYKERWLEKDRPRWPWNVILPFIGQMKFHKQCCSKLLFTLLKCVTAAVSSHCHETMEPRLHLALIQLNLCWFLLKIKGTKRVTDVGGEEYVITKSWFCIWATRKYKKNIVLCTNRKMRKEKGA